MSLELLRLGLGFHGKAIWSNQHTVYSGVVDITTDLDAVLVFHLATEVRSDFPIPCQGEIVWKRIFPEADGILHRERLTGKYLPVSRNLLLSPMDAGTLGAQPVSTCQYDIVFAPHLESATGSSSLNHGRTWCKNTIMIVIEDDPSRIDITSYHESIALIKFMQTKREEILADTGPETHETKRS